MAALAFSDDRKRRASGSGSVAGVGVGNSNTVGSGASAPGRITTPTGAAAGVGPAEQHGRSRRPSPARRNTVGSFALRPSPASVSTLSGGNQRRNGPTGGLGSSQGSIEDTEETENNTNNTQDDRKKQPVKRACNECRQQKVRCSIDIFCPFILLFFCRRSVYVYFSSLNEQFTHMFCNRLTFVFQLRCDVIQEPFAACSRCGRLKLECKIESNFKRIGKRSRNAEMEREIIELRRQIANANAAANAQQQHQQHQHSSSINQGPSSISTPFSSSQRNIYQTSTGLSGSQYMGSHEAVASLLDLRSGLDSSSFLRSSSSQVAMAKRLEGVSLAPERVTDLFSQLVFWIEIIERIQITFMLNMD